MNAPADKLSLKTFLETVPVLEKRSIPISLNGTHPVYQLPLPSIQLYCDGSECKRIGRFDPTDDTIRVVYSEGHWHQHEFVFYHCRNCKKTWKLYALHLHIAGGNPTTLNIVKIGERPRFGEPRPDPVLDVLVDEKEFFDKGYRAERDGLGIGAFAYYRRFVDSHKDKILDEIRQVAVAQNASPEVIATLDRAAKTNSFKRAVEEIKDAIPPVLFLKGGHNPLTLLYKALSEGVHEDDDAECLERAQDIRTVLSELAARTKQALENTKEVDAAVKRLLNRGAKGPPA
jgi:hypothetical protein